jgi:hypothetical protein
MYYAFAVYRERRGLMGLNPAPYSDVPGSNLAESLTVVSLMVINFRLYKIILENCLWIDQDLFYHILINYWGHTVALLVETLCSKSESRGFDSRWGQWIFSIDLINLAAV